MANKKVGISYIVALCGIVSALSLIMMFFLSLIPSFEYVSPAVAGLLIWIVKDQINTKWAVVSYISVAILSQFLSPNIEARMLFVFLLGYYPILRDYFANIKYKAVQLLLKLVLFNITAVAAYWLIINIFGMAEILKDMNEMGQYGSWILLGLGNIAFLAYDFFLGLFFPFYVKLLKPRIAKRLK